MSETDSEFVARLSHEAYNACRNRALAAEDEADRLRAEVERLRAGGCARDQNTTQYCAEAARLAAENERIRSALWEIDTACKNPGSWNELVLERIIERVEEIARAALQDKSDKSPEGKAASERKHEASKP